MPTLMAQGRSTKIISVIKWIQTSMLSMNKSLAGVLQLNQHRVTSLAVLGVQGAGFRVQGSGFGVEGCGLRVEG